MPRDGDDVVRFGQQGGPDDMFDHRQTVQRFQKLVRTDHAPRRPRRQNDDGDLFAVGNGADGDRIFHLLRRDLFGHAQQRNAVHREHRQRVDRGQGSGRQKTQQDVQSVLIRVVGAKSQQTRVAFVSQHQGDARVQTPAQPVDVGGGFLKRFRNGVFAVQRGKGAFDQHDFGAGVQRVADGFFDGFGIVRAHRAVNDAETVGGETLFQRVGVDRFGRRSRRDRPDVADFAKSVGSDFKQRARARNFCDRLI